MDESLTDKTSVDASLNNEPTNTQPSEDTADKQSQGTNSSDQSQENVSKDTAVQTNNESDDVDLSKFAKGQGIEDYSSLNERERKLLKVAYDNQKAYRTKPAGKKIQEASKQIVNETDADEVSKLRMEVQQMSFERKRSEFFNQDSVDASLENTMVDILNEKKAELGKDYAWKLSQDLETLYGMAERRNRAAISEAAKEEGRREERNSIKKQISASSDVAHATTSTLTTPPKVTKEWLQKEYDPKNPEHRELVSKTFGV